MAKPQKIKNYQILVIDLSGNKNISPDVWKFLIKELCICNLQKLTIKSCDLEEAHAKAIAAGMEEATTNTKGGMLNISYFDAQYNRNISPAGWNALFKVLIKYSAKKLQNFQINNCNIGENEIEAIEDAIIQSLKTYNKKIIKLQTFDMSNI